MNSLVHLKTGGPMHYQILGTLRVVTASGDVPDLPRQIRVLLAVLLMQPNHTISTARIAELMWNGNPPRRADAAIHVYVSQLRKVMAREGRACVLTRKPGYQLAVAEDALDLPIFRRLVDAGGAALSGGRTAEAAAILHRALQLWHGPALADLRENAAVDGFAAWLEDLHTECAEMLVEAQLILGDTANAVRLLRDLCRRHPLQEVHHRQLMEALYRSGRRAEALRTYTEARRVLAIELGVEPGPELRRCYHRVLRCDLAEPAAELIDAGSR
ncbi:BTAD domain-containing putative transcriptional regulator [Nocardia sp. NPDC057227]|uniref:AfsR/SARP family transcriptional regulator n=1 Tax=Nocardia sp. NPDC057227 TaxID=3346056 RepID=UPI0036355FD4